MLNKLTLSLILLSLVACRSAPFQVETLSVKEPAKVEPVDRKLINDFEGVLSEGMAARYKKAKSPSFALINGYYRLPSAKPFGAATIVRAYSYRTYYEAVQVTKPKRDYAIEPISGDDAIAFNQAFNALLDIGVKIKELSMSDALNIAKAESRAAKNDKAFQLSTLLPPNVDYLMSVYRSTSTRGPVLIGRVIKKDGTLLAFRVIYQGANNNLVGGLITTLFEDTINRI